MTPPRIRPATRTDYPTFVRLFAELGTDDPILEEPRFAVELVPTTFIAESETGTALGYAYYVIMNDTAYVRHVVTAPEARRAGVGRALMTSVLARAHEARCTKWCLNVRPSNVAAIALYEGLGLARTFSSRALKLDWALVENETPARGVRARPILPGEDGDVERTFGLIDGQLAGAREQEGRVLLMLEEGDGSVVGATIFHPHFPGAYPFRVARPELAWTLFHAIRPYATPSDTIINTVIEGQPALADLLVEAGATVRFEMVHMEGKLPTG